MLGIGCFLHRENMRLITTALLLTLSITLQYSCAVSPIDCNDAEPVAEKALDLINKGRRDGYLFQLLQVADAHLDKAALVAIYYLVLDVKESSCHVLSRKHWNDCEPEVSRRPSDIVIGQCKVIATTCSNETQDLRVKDFNCTTSSVYVALANTKDSPVLVDFLEDTDLYKKQADLALNKYKVDNDDFASFRVDKVEKVSRVRGEERTGYYVDFSVRNCSGHHFSRHFNVFGFCKADLFYNTEDLGLETPKDIIINCEVFYPEEHRNASGFHPPPGHHFHSGEQGHSHAGRPDGPKGHHNRHKPHKLGGPPPEAGRPPFGSGCDFHTKGTHRHPHHHNSSEHHSHGHPPHHNSSEHHHPHRHDPHGHHHHRNGPHGHRHHGPPPHGHHPPGHDFQDYRPCDPPPHRPGPHDHHTHPEHHGPRGHGPPFRHSEERGPGKRHFPFPRRQNGYVYRLPPLQKGEVLPSPEANFPTFPLPHHHHPPKPEIQPFPQSPSESCPGKVSEFPQLSKFFANILPK